MTKRHIWNLFFSYKIRDYIISWVQFYVNLQVNYDKHIQNPWNYHYFWGNALGMRNECIHSIQLRSERPYLKKMFIWKPVMESPVEGHTGCRLSSKPLFLTSQGRKGLGREKCLHVALRGNKDWAWNAVLEAHLTAEGAAKGRDVRSGMHWDPAVWSSGYSRGSLDKRLEKKIEMYPWNCAVFPKGIASFTDTSSIWQLTMVFNSIINNFDFVSWYDSSYFLW